MPRFSKKLLMSLEEGRVVVITSSPLFKEKIVALSQREAQWLRFKTAGASGKMCSIGDPSSSLSIFRL
jgi:hypothetical protein